MNFRKIAGICLFGLISVCGIPHSLPAQGNNADLQKGSVFPRGEKIRNNNFKGTAFLKMLMDADSLNPTTVGNVIFEPGARTKWHTHPGGQILLVLDGVGYYQEKGQAKKILRRGDVVKCPANVPHWHGASTSAAFVQVAITNRHLGETVWLQEVTDEEYAMASPGHPAVGQNSAVTKQTLTEKQKSIALISALTAKGDLPKLKQALHTGLDAGLTVNECKEVLVHVYAYCGFPRSIQGLNTLMTALDERKKKGIKDLAGKEATPVNDANKYETGWKNLATLGRRSTDGPVEKPTSGYGAFSPEIDRFLKEHLFADLFSRDVLTFAERELTTVSVLIALGSGVEPMLSSHMALAIRQGFTKSQLEEVLRLIGESVSKPDADAARKVWSEIKNVE